MGSLRKALSVLLLAAAAAAPGCSTFRPDWREQEVEGLAFEDLWEALRQSVEAAGFVPDLAATDRGDRRLVSRWRVRPGAFATGVRTRAVAEVLEGERAGAYEVRLYVERQRNKNMGRAFEPREEDWSGDGQDVHGERMILRHLSLRLDRLLGIGRLPEAVAPMGGEARTGG